VPYARQAECSTLDRQSAVHQRQAECSTPETGGVPYSIAGYRRTLVLDNRTAYHGYFDFLRLETGFQLSSSWVNDSCYGLNRNRSALIFMRWTHIDLGAQDLNGIQRPKKVQKNRSKVLDEYYNSYLRK
jgi:hypothetical protein